MTEVADNISNMGNPIKVQLELVNLTHDVVVPSDLGIGIVDQVASTIVYMVGHDL